MTQFLRLSLEDTVELKEAIGSTDLVIHCAGPFRDRNLSVLNLCIRTGTSYLDVSDSPDYVRQALTYQFLVGIKTLTGAGGHGLGDGDRFHEAEQGYDGGIGQE